jgi:hypothetical protein
MELAEEMEATAAAVFHAATTALLPKGLAPPPQVFVFSRLGEPAEGLVGQITCRPYRRGADAADAIAGLGLVAAAVGGTDLLVFWEEYDLRTSLYGPSEDHPNGFAVLQVTWESHFLAWFPFTTTVLGWRGNGLPEVQIVRGEPSENVEGVQLHDPIHRLLDAWRTATGSYDYDTECKIINTAAQNGYDVAFVTKKR